MTSSASPEVPTLGNQFAYLWRLGYRRLCPIIPPGAPLSPKSFIYKRLQEGEDARGKAPGVLRRDGLWCGFDFVKHESTEEDCDRWHEMGAGVGVKLGRGLVALDIDVLHKATSVDLYHLAEKMLAAGAPVRVGRRPKALLLYRVAGNANVPYDKVRFTMPDGANGLVEILSEGRQFVALGTHPATQKPYEWNTGKVPRIEDLPEVSPEALVEYLAEIERTMPAAQRFSGGSADRSEIDQARLRGDPQLVADAIKHLPNRDADYPTRDDWIRTGYAIKAALGPGLEDDALELWQQWGGRWDGGDNDPEWAEHEFARMHPPFAIGASYLYEQAEKQADWRGRVEHFFRDAGADEDLRTLLPEETPAPPIVPGRITLDDLADLPPRQWLYGTKISRKYVTFLASPGGVGKTAWTIAAALACATGETLLHDRPVKPLRVWLYNLEDDLLEVKRRLKAALMHYQLPGTVLDSIRVTSGRDRRLCIVAQGKLGPVVQPDYAAMVKALRDEQIDLLIADPVLRTHRVSENDNEAQDEVLRLFAQIGDEANCGVLLVHHFRKGGQSGDMDSMRGGSTQGGGARSVITMAAMSPEEAAKLGVPEERRRLHVRLDDAKNNMAPPARAAEWIVLSDVELGNGDEMYPAGDRVQVASAYQLPEAFEGLADIDEAAILADLERGPEEGERYTRHGKTGTSRAFVTLLQERYGRTPAQATSLIHAWLKSGLIEERTYRNKQRRSAKGLFVNGAAAAERRLPGVFD